MGNHDERDEREESAGSGCLTGRAGGVEVDIVNLLLGVLCRLAGNGGGTGSDVGPGLVAEAPALALTDERLANAFHTPELIPPTRLLP